ncbi:LuxR C-terminal-related transcriptional regulator [Streptomyces sp. NPDC056534]|uniref:helix-turn-helix transcriptional regulator n=1 Tax=Streptomyces sp. NPDC056534 TaxID=3345857 RepID=UPI0036C235B3
MDLSDPVAGFAEVVRVMGAGERRRVALVNDLHLLDAASAVLLRALVDAGVLRLVGTVRTGAPLGKAVAALCGVAGMSSVELAQLDREQTAEVLRAVLGGAVGRRAVNELYAVSGGNLLYLRELVTGAVEAGTLSSDGEIWDLAEGRPVGTPKLAELIGVRLAAAKPQARPVLELIALCEPVPLVDVTAVAGAEALGSLESQGLVQVTQDRRRRSVMLAHPLYGEVLRAAMPALKRRALLLDQVQRAEAHGGRRHEDSLRITAWRLAATGTADPWQLARAAAIARHAHDYQQAVALLRALPTEHHTTATRLLYGETRYELGEFDRAEEIFADATGHAASEGETLAIAMERTQNLLWGLGRVDRALEANAEAENAIGDVGMRKVLAVNRGAMQIFAGDPVDGLAVLDGAESIPDIRARVYGMALRVVGLAATGQSSQAVQMGERAYAEHRGAHSEIVVHHPTVQLPGLVEAYAAYGDLQQAKSMALEGLEAAVDTRTRTSLLYVLGSTEWLAGHLAEARRSFAEAGRLARDRNTWLLRSAASGLAACSTLLGDTESAEAALVGLGDHPQVAHLEGDECWGRAWILGSQGRTAEARAVLSEGAAISRASGRRTSEARLLTDIARLGGAGEVAARLTELAEICDGPFPQARAHFATALAAHDPAGLLEAAEQFGKLGAYLLAAEAATAAAVAWQHQGQPRQAVTATGQARRHAARCPGVHTPLLSFTSAATPLTPREHEIAALAASGHASRTIASTLNLSVRTVNNHLQHAYAKLNVTTRQQLAKAMRTTRSQ